MTEALVPSGEAIELTLSGIIVHRDISYAEWEQSIKAALRYAKALPRIVAALIVYGEERWGETYAQAIDETGYDIQTLQNWVWVYRRISDAEWLARPSLSFGHWSEVAAMEPEARTALLDIAEAESWSVRELRQARLGLGTGREVLEPSSPSAPLPTNGVAANGETCYALAVTLREALWIVERAGVPVGLCQRAQELIAQVRAGN